jgi:hypothetical protein
MATTGFLSPEDYQAVIAPALHAAAMVAARRGDPKLCNDLASMLALMALVKGLVRLHRAGCEPMGQSAPAPVFEGAPLAACVMVLGEAGIEPPLLDQMTGALEAAYAELAAANVIGPEDVLVSPAWERLAVGDAAEGGVLLRNAAQRITAAVDAWERQRPQ